MNNKILKIMVLLCTLVVGFQQVVYADVADLETPLNDVNPLILVGTFIGISIVVGLSISFLAALSSKRPAKNNSGDIDERKYQTGKREFENFFYLLTIAFLAMFFSFSILYYEMEIKVFLYCFSFPCIALFIRIFNRKISNILCIAFLAVFAIASIIFMIDSADSFKFNHQFEKYIHGEKVAQGDIDKLINTVIKSNNENSRKVEIDYQNSNYLTEDELNELIKSVNTDKTYYAYTDKNDRFINRINIRMNKPSDKSLMSKSEMEGFNAVYAVYNGIQTGSKVKVLINRLIANAITYQEEPKRIPVFSYNAGIDENPTQNGRPEVDKHAWAVMYESKIEGYLNYLSTVSEGLDLKHEYNVTLTYDEDGIISGITVNYDKDANVENFTISDDPSAVCGLVGSTGIEIEFDK